MASRRTFLKAGLSACAAGAVIAPASAEPVLASAHTDAAPYYYRAIFDERFDAARTFAANAAARGIATASIRGDVTRLFYDDLDPRWKKGPVALAGYTTPAALSCLDLLARDRGMHVSHRAVEPGGRLVFWIINPKSAAPILT
jgi:hypothetical protein